MNKIDLEELKEIATFLKENDLNEIWVERKGYKIGLRRDREGKIVQSISGEVPTFKEEVKKFKKEDKEPPSSNLYHIKAPLVGTFRRGTSPTAPPLIKEGDEVAVGQTLGFIEAMKIFNDVKAEVAGRVIKILIEDSQPIEFNQSLFVIEKK